MLSACGAPAACLLRAWLGRWQWLLGCTMISPLRLLLATIRGGRFLLLLASPSLEGIGQSAILPACTHCI